MRRAEAGAAHKVVGASGTDGVRRRRRWQQPGGVMHAVFEWMDVWV
jgi:hypothetical protein